ncbi:MAG: (2Fe-2S)-binding protein [Erysipelotrichales bacterium]
MSEDVMICYCSNVSKKDIIEAIDKGAKTIDDIREMTSACTISNCIEMNPKKRCCSSDIIEVLNKYVK